MFPSSCAGSAAVTAACGKGNGIDHIGIQVFGNDVILYPIDEVQFPDRPGGIHFGKRINNISVLRELGCASGNDDG